MAILPGRLGAAELSDCPLAFRLPHPLILTTMKLKPTITALADLMAHAEGHEGYLMRRSGHVPPTLFVATPQGVLVYVPNDLSDTRAKDVFATTSRLICAAYAATAVVMVVEGWVTMAKPGEELDTDTPPSEALDRQEFVILMGEVAGQKQQKMLPIIRTDAGGFFGFGEFDSLFSGFEGRFDGLLPPKVPTAQQRLLAKAVLERMGVTDAVLGVGFPRN